MAGAVRSRVEAKMRAQRPQANGHCHSIDGDDEAMTRELEALDREMLLAHSPPVDVMVRTSGVHRLSDFMLWQVSDLRNCSASGRQATDASLHYCLSATGHAVNYDALCVDLLARLWHEGHAAHFARLASPPVPQVAVGYGWRRAAEQFFMLRPTVAFEPSAIC